MKEIRVSHIASITWCEVKAKALMEGYEPTKTDAMEEGEEMHELFGFNENLEVSREVMGYKIVGHVDKLLNGIVYEFKTYRERYPLNYLLSYAIAQANIYAFLCNVRNYVVIVFNVNKKTFWGFINEIDEAKALYDINTAISILEGKVSPMPTNCKWKCDICELRGGICDRYNIR